MRLLIKAPLNKELLVYDRADSMEPTAKVKDF